MLTQYDLATWTFDEIQIGQFATLEYTVDEESIDQFARLSGDFSPLHMNDQFAKQSRYGERIAHGMLACIPISTLVGMRLPGENAVLLSVQIEFAQPAKQGETLLLRGEVLRKIPMTHSIVINLIITNIQTNEIVTRGRAIVLVEEPISEL
jgi:3-hydroxybutyryl-CoA dehydratase